MTHSPTLNPAATVYERTIQLGHGKVAYREAGTPGRSTLVLLHGFPSSSLMYTPLLERLGHQYHLIAPDYPGFGHSSDPEVPTFDHLAAVVERLIDALEVKRYSLYMQDYGAAVGMRLVLNRPERVQALIFQNGNVYEEGLRPDFWASSRALWQRRTPETEAPLRAVLAPQTAQFLFGFGMRDARAIRPEVLEDAGQLLGNPERHDALLELFDNYRTNVEQYATWQAYLRRDQPPTLVLWGQNDPVFGPEGALAFRHDLPQAEVHLLNSGHFALEEEADVIAVLLDRFLARYG